MLFFKKFQVIFKIDPRLIKISISWTFFISELRSLCGRFWISDSQLKAVIADNFCFTSFLSRFKYRLTSDFCFAALALPWILTKTTVEKLQAKIFSSVVYIHAGTMKLSIKIPNLIFSLIMLLRFFQDTCNVLMTYCKLLV